MGRTAEKIFGRLNNRRKSYLDVIISLHDLFMSEYGWIPLEEFRHLPMQTMLDLFQAMEARYKMQAKKMKGRK